VVADLCFDLAIEQLTSKSIDDFFIENGISDFKERVHMLNKYMGACDEGTFFGGDLDAENLYKLTKEIVLDKDWLAFK